MKSRGLRVTNRGNVLIESRELLISKEDGGGSVGSMVRAVSEYSLVNIKFWPITSRTIVTKSTPISDLYDLIPFNYI